MFKNENSAQAYWFLWRKEPKVGDQMTVGRILIELKRIDGDPLFWEEVPSGETREQLDHSSTSFNECGST